MLNFASADQSRAYSRPYMMSAPATILRFRPLARVVFGLGFLFCLGMIGLAGQIFLDGSHILAIVAAPAFLWLAVLTWREGRRVWTYEIELGPSWIRCGVAGRNVVVRIADLSTYLEAPMRFQDHGFGGYQFILRDVRGQTIHFSTQIAGWSALHDSLHAIRPELVPRATDTAARSRVGIGKVPMTFIAAMLTATGQDTPDGWNGSTRGRLLDAAVGSALGVCAALLLAVVAIRPFTHLASGWGVPNLVAVFPALLLDLWFASHIPRLYVSAVTWARMLAASARAKRAPFTDPDKTRFVASIATMLSVQLTAIGEDSIDDASGVVNPRALGYIYGFIDGALRTIGRDMADAEIGPPITYHVLRRLFPGKEQEYLTFLRSKLRSDPVVAAAILAGGQQYLDFNNGKLAAPMGLARAILESS